MRIVSPPENAETPDYPLSVRFLGRRARSGRDMGARARKLTGPELETVHTVIQSGGSLPKTPYARAVS
jgi:hypothetical protein